MVRQIVEGDPKVWIKVVDRETGQGWDVSPEWLKQHLDICDLKATTEHLQKQIDELETALINHKMPLARDYLAELFHRKGEINTRKLNSFIAKSGSRLDRKTVETAFEQMVADGTLQFKRQGKGHPRLWFLKEADQK